VTLTSGELASVTHEDFLKQRSLILVGNEIIGFRDADLIAPMQYELTTLLRGQRGTEWAISQVKALDSPVYLLKSSSAGVPVARITASPNLINTTIKLKCVPQGRSIDSVATETAYLIQGNSLKPYAPASDVIVQKDVSGNLLINWHRRARKYGQLSDNLPVPLVESREEYDLEILDNAGILKRTLRIQDVSEYTYSVTDQVTDFGSQPTQIRLNIYQISDFLGRGYVRSTGIIDLP
jgi:hypothetical protein